MRRLKTGRRPPIYPKTPGHLPCSSLTHPLPLPSRRPSVSFGGFGLSFESASAFGIFDRGLLRPGMAADITIFDPETVRPLPEDVVSDFPAGGWRLRELAEGIICTIVNGEVLIENGKHTGSLPGRVMRNARYHADSS